MGPISQQRFKQAVREAATLKLYQRICLILAYEGISGLFRRMARKLLPLPSTPKISVKAPRKEYLRLKEAFDRKAMKMGYGDLSRYLWYHTVDLGNGLVTPGIYDYRQVLPLFRFPERMDGLHVLDVGSATGFFSFEFERRGAQVMSVELPSIAEWDMLPGEDKEKTLKSLMEEHHARTIKELHYFHLEGPFEFCRRVLNSKVRRCYSSIYDLNDEKVGRESFDLVFIGDVLLHLFSPLRAVAAIAPLCRKTLIISQELADIKDTVPAMLYVGGEKRSRDSRTWWLPNLFCFEQMLKRLGFRIIQVVGYHSGIHGLSGRIYRKRAIIHALR